MDGLLTLTQTSGPLGSHGPMQYIMNNENAAYDEILVYLAFVIC